MDFFPFPPFLPLSLHREQLALFSLFFFSAAEGGLLAEEGPFLGAFPFVGESFPFFHRTRTDPLAVFFPSLIGPRTRRFAARTVVFCSPFFQIVPSTG